MTFCCLRMKRRPCKRQVQAVKIIVAFSAAILIVLWFAYFKFPDIFSHTDVDAIPEHAQNVNYFTAQVGDNDTEVLEDTDLRIEMNTISSRVATSQISQTEHMSNSKREPTTSSYNSNVSKTSAYSETRNPQNQDETNDSVEDNAISLSEEDFTEESDNSQTTVESSTTISTPLADDSDTASVDNVQSNSFTGTVRPQTKANNILTESTMSASGLGESESETYTSTTTSTHGVTKSDKENTSAKSSDNANLTSPEPTTVETTQEDSAEIHVAKFSNENPHRSTEASSIEDKNGNTESGQETIEQTDSQTTKHTSTVTTVMDEELDVDSTADTRDSSTVDSSTVDSSTMDSSTLDSSTMDGSTLESSTGDNSTMNSSTLDSSTMEDSTVDSSTSVDGASMRVTRIDAPYTDVELFFDERATDHTILLWNTVDWVLHAHAEVEMGECRYANCRLTTDKHQLRNASAVVFHISDDENVDEWRTFAENDRNPNQVWVYQNLNPLLDVDLPKSFDNLFNWSWSYRPTADIFQPYGAFFKRGEAPTKSYHDIYLNKRKSAVWISDECDIPLRVQNNVNKLRENIQVDIITPCNSTADHDIEKLVNEYAFYLVFDTHLKQVTDEIIAEYFCNDFISDEFFRFSNLDVIAVVAGEGHYKTLPSGSFINPLDFPLVEDLGEYLAELVANEELYVSHLIRKDEYRAVDKVFMYRNALCNVCERLNNKEHYQKVYSLEDMYAYLGKCSDVEGFDEF